MTKSRNQKRLDVLHDGRAIECIVSDRYLLFSKPSPTAIQVGHPVFVDVMVNNYGDKADKKLCQLTLSMEDIEGLASLLRSDLPNEGVVE